VRVVQAAGYAILGKFHPERWKCTNPRPFDLLDPTVLDIPDKIDSVILEYPDPIGPWGARGMAEMPLCH